MPDRWQYPVTVPVITDALAQEIVDAARAAGRKPTAFGTRLRFSDAGKCTRAVAYGALGLEGDGIDPSGLHVAWIGTLYHEHLQAALQRRYPGAEIEVKGHLPDVTDSGHADALLSEDVLTAVIPEWDGASALYELKTKSSFQFDKAVGYMRKSWKAKDPEGPGREVILQAGLNALANDCDTLIVGYVTFENISVTAAEKLGLRHFDRFLAEWHIPKDVWLPMVERELDRLHFVLDCIDGGQLPDRNVYADDGDLLEIGPEQVRPHWSCSYCGFRLQCEKDGPGIVPVPVELRRVT